MAIVIWLFLFLLIILVFILVYPRIKIPHDPDKELREGVGSIRSYDKVSRWPIAIFLRRLILSELMKYRVHGIVLDIGCGPGYLLNSLNKQYSNLFPIGLDISGDMLKQASLNCNKSSNSLQFIQGDVCKLPLNDNSIDFILSSFSLHHWDNVESSFSELIRVLKPDGQFLIFDVRRNSRRWFYYVLLISQSFFVPVDIRRDNGLIGSFWSSYTNTEMSIILNKFCLKDLEIKPQFGWMFLAGKKCS